MRYIRTFDLAAVKTADGKLMEPLLEADSGLDTVGINLIRTPPGGGSPRGLHTHVIDQTFLVLAGLMHLEIDGEFHQVGPGHLVIFPAGVPHRNWNEGPEATVHLAINTPFPSPDLPFAIPYPAQ